MCRFLRELIDIKTIDAGDIQAEPHITRTNKIEHGIILYCKTSPQIPPRVSITIIHNTKPSHKVYKPRKLQVDEEVYNTLKNTVNNIETNYHIIKKSHDAYYDRKKKRRR